MAYRNVGLKRARAESENDDSENEQRDRSTIPCNDGRDSSDDDQDVGEDGAVDAALNGLVATPFRVRNPAADERAKVHPET